MQTTLWIYTFRTQRFMSMEKDHKVKIDQL